MSEVLSRNTSEVRIEPEGQKRLVIVEGAGHLFEEPGTLDEVVRHATRWFLDHLHPSAERS